MTNGQIYSLMRTTSIPHQTKDAEVTLQAHPQRVPEAEIGAKSGAANGPPRAKGNGKPEYLTTYCLR